MKLSVLTTLFLPSSAICHVIYTEAKPGSSPSTSIIPSATPPSTHTSNAQAPTPLLYESVLDVLDLRQVAAAPGAPGNPAAPNAVAAPPANPAVPPVVNPAAPANPVVPPAVNPDVPAVPTVTSGPDPQGEHISVTVQWIETWVGGTSQTWVPKTITMKFGVVMSQAPEPGKGVAGMGTLKGEVGVTKTVVVGAAPTMGSGWKGVVAAVGVGLAGLVI